MATLCFCGVEQEAEAWCFLWVGALHSSVCWGGLLPLSASSECDLLVPKGCPHYHILLGNKRAILQRVTFVVLCHWCYRVPCVQTLK